MAGDGAHFYRPAEGTGLPHDPFNAIVGPRPIGWISTRAADGVQPGALQLLQRFQLPSADHRIRLGRLEGQRGQHRGHR
ncbi:MAG: hypothetical protein U5N53_13910 [Mycobacterium sp.]|nr:hypothetical protein [Mycobacterium sp.]